MSFQSLGLTRHLVNELTKQGIKKPYPIQEEAIPAILKKKDVLGIAKTGSGKTASYVLPVLMNLKGKTNTMDREVPVLVLVPTRELAIQVEEVFRTYGAALPYEFKSMAVYGGASINPQMKNMNNVDVLVATPGRLLELHDRKACHFNKFRVLVLDEADKMLNVGFKQEMRHILRLLPLDRQNLLFSATLSPDVQNIQDVILDDPVVIKFEEEKQSLDLINMIGYSVSKERKGPLLRYLIKQNDMKQVLVFTSSVYSTDLVTAKLMKNGILARAIHSKKSQGNRQEALAEFKAGRLPVLVATDLLSRGIDIEFLPHVINYELPRSPKDFIHRIGRTGRAENPGEAISLVTPEDEKHFRVIQKKVKRRIDLIDTSEYNLHGF